MGRTLLNEKNLDSPLYGSSEYGIIRDMENNSLPILPVVVVGKDRTRMTCAVIDHLKKHIKNASPYFICVSDRSRAGHDEVIKKHLQNNGEKRYQVLRTLPEENRYGWGSAINIGLACAFDICAEAGCALVVDNDWLLQKDLDIDKYLYAFAFSSIGAITFKQINAGTNINLIETSLADGSTYLRRERGSSDRYSFTAEIGCMLITRPLYETYGKFTENCRTDETEWDFCNWYNRLTAEERSEKNLWFATDKDLYHEVLNGEGHVFTHVGLHSQHKGPHKWDVPDEYLYLSNDEEDAKICHDAYWILVRTETATQMHKTESAQSVAKIPVVVVGRDRTRMTCAVIDHLKEHIKNAKPYFIYVSDRSRNGHLKVIENHLRSIGEIEFKVAQTNPEEGRYGLGAAMNIGVAESNKMGSDAVVIVENDQILVKDIIIDKYISAFKSTDIGAVTFRRITRATNSDLSEHVYASDGGIYALRRPNYNKYWTYAANFGCVIYSSAMLRQIRFKEACSPGDCEHNLCLWYKSLSDKQRTCKKIWFASDVYFENDKTQDEVFVHAGAIPVPLIFADINNDAKDTELCKAVSDEAKDMKEKNDSADLRIHWEKYFDRIYIQFFCSNGFDRMSRLKAELRRVDILDSPILEWDYGTSCAYDKSVFIEQENQYLQSVNYTNHALQLLRELKRAKAFGYRRILILEDDIAFLKDKKRIKMLLESLPEDCDMVQLDKFLPVSMKNQYDTAVAKSGYGALFVDIEELPMPSASANVYTSSGIDKAISALEAHLVSCDRLPIHRKVAVDNICVQIFYNGCNAGKQDLNALHDLYVRQGIDKKYSDYSVPKGYEYGKLFSPPCELHEKINWKKYVDKIYCIHHLTYKDRYHYLMSELDRIGILDSGIFEMRYTTPSRYDKEVEKCAQFHILQDGFCANLTLENLRIFNEALLLGYKRIMILEDDIAFLKDISIMKGILEEIPPTSDIVQLEKFIPSKYMASYSNDILKDQINNRFFDPKGKRYFGNGCMIYQGRGIESMRNAIEHDLRPPDEYSGDLKCKRAIAKMNIGVQILWNNAHNRKLTGDAYLWKCYAMQGVEVKDYAFPEGYRAGTSFSNNKSKAEDSDKILLTENKLPDIHHEIHPNRHALINLIASIGKDNLELLEIGSCMGDSAEAFLLTGKVKRITCVDPWKDFKSNNPCCQHLEMERKEKIFDALMQPFGDKVVKFKGTFREFIESQSHKKIEYDMVYIDALHDYDSVKRDISDALTYVRPRLGVAGHDYFPGHRWLHGVVKAVNEQFAGQIKVFADGSWIHLFTEDEKRWMNAKKKGRKFISIYAIAKNEASVAQRWYECVKEADEVCVLDTGSTDKTVQILRDLGAKVTVKTYEDWSFAVARNDSMHLVSPESEILFTLDLDETIAPGWRKKLEDAWISEEEKGNNPVGVMYKYIWSFNSDGTESQSFSVRKIHAKGVGKWKYRCHELLTEVNGHTFFLNDFIVEHHQNKTTNRSKYLPLLEKDAKEMPNDDRSAYYYARELMYGNKWVEAIEEFKRHLTLPSAGWRCERASSMRNIAYCYKHLNSEAKTELWLWKSAEEDPTNREATYFLGEMAMERKDYRMAVKVFERCLAIKEPSLEYITLPIVWSARPWFLYAQALWWTGRWDEAVEASKKAAEIEPKNQEVRKQVEDMRATRDRYKTGKIS